MNKQRRPIIAANWKMFMSPQEGAALAIQIVDILDGIPSVETVLCPPAVTLTAVANVLRGSEILLGAQNVHWENEGAYTGEVSAVMLSGWCAYVIIGHSERRQYFGESDENVNRKVKVALANELTSIICVGENLEENEAGRTGEVVERQLHAAYSGLSADEALRTVVAYEPVWAIGSGRAATPGGANSVCAAYVRMPLRELFGGGVADAVRVQYGGSVKPDNIEKFMAEPDIDGALIGGASLSAESFCAIVRSAG